MRVLWQSLQTTRAQETSHSGRLCAILFQIFWGLVLQDFFYCWEGDWVICYQSCWLKTWCVGVKRDKAVVRKHIYWNLLHMSGILLRKLDALDAWPVNMKLSLARFEIYLPKSQMATTTKSKTNEIYVLKIWYAFHLYATWLCTLHIDWLYVM